MEKQAYSIKEFAEIIDVHPNTIRKGIKSGKISAFRVGCGIKSSWRIPHGEIERMIAYNMKNVIDRLVEYKIANGKTIN